MMIESGNLLSILIGGAIIVAVLYVLIRLFVPKKMRECDLKAEDMHDILIPTDESEREELREKLWLKVSQCQEESTKLFKQKRILDLKLKISIDAGLEAMEHIKQLEH